MPIGKRDEICAAALQLFVERGISATTTREIAGRAHTAEGNLYRHFKSKDHLAQYVFELCASRLMEALVKSMRESAGPAENLKGLIRAMFGFSREGPDAFRFILMSHHRHLSTPDDIYRKGLPKELFIEVLRAGVSGGDFRDVDPVLATGWIVGMTQKAIVFMQSGGIEMPNEKVIDETVESALRMISGN